MAASASGGGLLCLAMVVLLAAAALEAAETNSSVVFEVTRKSFPEGFIFGAASSAYQYEGAANEGGRGPSIWDTYTHQHADKIKGGSNGDVAIDFYHRYKEDLNMVKGMNMDAFRFSISWSRVLPKGTIKGGINKEGVQFYNNLINYLLANGLQPFVTLFHWDLPQALETEYLGFLSPRIADDFRDYAELMFQLFGDRVKYWTTFNEPWSFCERGYSFGTFAPGRCSSFAPGKCAQGNSATEPYIAGHNLLLAHAAAVKVYRDKYKATQKGVIGITLVTNWFKPYSSSKADFDAVGRALDFMFGWFMDPLTTGDYPFNMRAIVRERLPAFTPEQAKLVKGSYDFLGLNYYTTWYAKSIPLSTPVNVSYDSDNWAFESGLRNGVPIGRPDPLGFFFTYPQGLNKLLHYIKDKYNNPTIYITENGIDDLSDPSIPREKSLKDTWRIDFYRQHFYYLQKTIKEGVNVKGFFAWTLMDDFEWESGFSLRFGIIYVDFKTLQRYPKLSSSWFRQVLKK